MTRSDPPLAAVDDIRQLNHLFLGFLRQRPDQATRRFGLSVKAAELVCAAPAKAIDRAASFPRALFRLRLPEPEAVAIDDLVSLGREGGERVLELVLLHSARSLCRVSGYSARLLLRLRTDEVDRLRRAAVEDVVAMSFAPNLVGAAFDDLDWIWNELLNQARPEFRRRLLLIGFQPDEVLSPGHALP